jgi:dienelactone hydrolase
MRHKPKKIDYFLSLIKSIIFIICIFLVGFAPEFTIQINPIEALFGIPASIKIEGLKAGESVTLQAQSQDASGVIWKSESTFVADQAGVVDIEKQAPVSGDYTIADSLSPFWSMKPVDIEENKRKPYEFENLEYILVQLTATTSSRKSVTKDFKRYFQLPGQELVQVPIEKEGLKGILYHPADKGPHPCVILLAGSGGGIQKWWAQVMASNGFAALTLPYFNYEDLPLQLTEIPIEYFAEAIAWLKTQKSIDSNRIAVMGASKGGELSLLLGATFPEIKAVVACVPSGIIWAGISQGEMASSWSMNGKGIPFAQWHFSQEDYMKMASGQPISLLETYSLKNIAAEELEKATIPVEKINGPILLVSGTDDQMWPSTQFSEMVMQRLEEHNHPHEGIHLKYEGAGHLVFLPYLITGGNWMSGRFIFGGNPKADAHSSVDAWAKMLDFLHKHLQ